VALQDLPIPSAEEVASVVAFSALEKEHRKALRAYREGDYEKARPVLEKTAEQGRKLFLARLMIPDQHSQDWIRFHSSVLLLADLHRYRTNELEKAREIEQQLAEEAEELGYPLLAAIQWLSVGEIQEKLLGDNAAAGAAYERVLAVAERAKGGDTPGVPRYLVDLARLSLDRLNTGKPGYKRRLAAIAVPYEIEEQGGQVRRLILPHLKGYGGHKTDNPWARNRDFADAHADSFRGAFADYSSVFVAFLYPGKWEQPGEAVLRFFERYPDDLLGFGISSWALNIFHEREQEDRYTKELQRARERAERLGLALTVEKEA
jgi:hypothetical protein